MSEMIAADAPVDLADEKQVAARKLTKKQSERRADEDLEFIMSTPAGRRFVARLMSISPYNQLSYRDGEADDGRGMAFREGRRSVCADLILNVIRVSPAGYGLMMNENNEGN